MTNNEIYALKTAAEGFAADTIWLHKACAHNLFQNEESFKYAADKVLRRFVSVLSTDTLIDLQARFKEEIEARNNRG